MPASKWARSSRGTKIPAFDEVLDYARGKIDIYVDVKQVTAKELVDHIVGHGMADHVVIYSGRISKDVRQLNPVLKIMPEAVSVELAQRTIAELHPEGDGLRRFRLEA